MKRKGKGETDRLDNSSKNSQEEQFPDEPIHLEQVLQALKATRELDVNLHGGFRLLA
jgi:hypothetical protein